MAPHIYIYTSHGGGKHAGKGEGEEREGKTGASIHVTAGGGKVHLHLQIDIGAVKTDSPFNHLPGTLSLYFPGRC